MKTMFQFRRH